MFPVKNQVIFATVFVKFPPNIIQLAPFNRSLIITNDGVQSHYRFANSRQKIFIILMYLNQTRFLMIQLGIGNSNVPKTNVSCSVISILTPFVHVLSLEYRRLTRKNLTMDLSHTRFIVKKKIALN